MPKVTNLAFQIDEPHIVAVFFMSFCFQILNDTCQILIHAATMHFFQIALFSLHYIWQNVEIAVFISSCSNLGVAGVLL